jgi:hypothetical protein
MALALGSRSLFGSFPDRTPIAGVLLLCFVLRQNILFGLLRSSTVFISLPPLPLMVLEITMVVDFSLLIFTLGGWFLF